MKKIIFDCDNTFGVKDCDVDDGLALMYLLGNRETQLLGIDVHLWKQQPGCGAGSESADAGRIGAQGYCL